MLHLSAHFQGFCRELYMEATQAPVAIMPVEAQPIAQRQFVAELALDRGNPNVHNISKDLRRLVLSFDFQVVAANRGWRPPWDI